MPYPLHSTSRQYATSRGQSPSKLGKRDDEQKAKDCLKNLLVLAEQRLFWEPMIDNIIAYVNHGRRFITDRDLWDGQQTGQYVFDDSAMLACNIFVDGMVGNLCSRNQPWFAFELPGKFNFPRSSGMRAWSGKRVDSYPEVQRWLQDSQDVSYSAFNRSNFYDVFPEFIRDGGSAGTAHLLAEEDVLRNAIVFTVPHFRECYIAENQWKKVDTCYRVYKMTLRQLAQKFGWEEMISIEPNFERDYESNMHGERDVLHAVYPREDYEPWRIDAKGKPWVSEWVYCRGGKILAPGTGKTSPSLSDAKNVIAKESGYDSMPIITWRYRVNDDEVYGRGPAHDAFVSISLANQMGRTNLITAQKAAEPPLAAYSDQRGAIQRGPNGITYLESNRGDLRSRMPQLLATGVQNLPFNIEYQDKVRQVINEHFHTDVFMMMSQLAKGKDTSRMVTEQIAELQGEKAAILGTRVGNLQSEAFDPLIFRVYSIEAAAGRIPEPPQILLESEHGPIEVQYLGPLAQAQTRLNTVRTIQTSHAVIAQLAQLNPTVIDMIDADKELMLVLNKLGYPAECYRDPRMVLQIREHRNQLAEQARIAEQAPQLAKAAAAMSKAPDAQSPLKMLLGGGEQA
jgi:Bacteriophage head to tail connecting protein